MTMDRDAARDIAEQKLGTIYEQGGETLAIDDAATREEDIGWVFYYQTKQYLERRDPDQQLIGNAPIVVDRDGNIYETGTGQPIEHYLDEIRARLGR